MELVVSDQGTSDNFGTSRAYGQAAGSIIPNLNAKREPDSPEVESFAQSEVPAKFTRRLLPDRFPHRSACRPAREDSLLRHLKPLAGFAGGYRARKVGLTIDISMDVNQSIQDQMSPNTETYRRRERSPIFFH